MGRTLLPNPYNRFSRDAFEVFDDFNEYVSTDLWTDFQADAQSTVALADGQHSILKLQASVDNESAGFYSTYELFKFIANKALYAEAWVKLLDVGTYTNESAYFFGFADAFAVDMIADGGATIAINDSGAVLYKISGAGVDGAGEAWCFHTEIGGAAVASTSTTVPAGTAAVATAWTRLVIDVVPVSSTVLQARPFVDGKQLIDSTSGALIQHDITLGTATDMQLGFEIKAGHADHTTAEFDYIYASQSRATT
jgi:hypothetical protein